MSTRRERVLLDLDPGGYVRGLATARAANAGFISSLDTTNDRAAMVTQSVLAIGPAMTPTIAAAAPALAALTGQLTAAGLGAGVTVAAFQGVGDTLSALSDYRVEPTADNFAKLQAQMEQLPESAQEFVRFYDGQVAPLLDRLQTASADGVMPGAVEGIDELLERAPQLRRIVAEVADASGQLMAESGADLASEEWDPFFDYLENEAGPQLIDFGRTSGNVLQGLANTLAAASPYTSQFTGGLLDWSESFAEASENLDESDGFRQFMDYAVDAGPQVLDTLGSLGGAVLAVAEAAAPVGDVALPVLEVLADTLAAVADSPAGPVLIATAAGVSAISRAVGLYNAANGSALVGMLRNSSSTGSAAGAGFRAAAAGAGILALSLTDVDDSLGITNTAMGAMIGGTFGPWGAAAGAAAGGAMDLKAQTDQLADSIDAVYAAIDSGDMSRLRDEMDRVEKDLDDFLSSDITSLKDTGIAAAIAGPIGLIGSTLKPGVDAAGDLWGRLSGDVQEGVRALEDGRQALRGTSGAATLLSGPLGLTSDGFRAASQSAQGFANSLARVNRTLTGRSNLRDYEAAIDDFTASMRENGRTLNINTAAGRANQAALDQIASTALTVAENMRGANRVRFLSGARSDFIAAARDIGKTREQAERLADRFGLLETKKPKIDVETGQARRKLDQARNWIDDWGRQRAAAKADADNTPGKRKLDQARNWLTDWGNDRKAATADADNRPARTSIDAAIKRLSDYDGSIWTSVARVNNDQAMTAIGAVAGALAGLNNKTVTVTTVQRTVRGKAGGGEVLPDPWARAPRTAYTGAMVPKTGLGYADRHPYLLADGEHVTPNDIGQADRNRAALYAAADGATLAVVDDTAGAGRYTRQGVIQRTTAAEVWAPARASGGGGSSQQVTVTLSDAQVARLAAAQERGSERGTARGAHAGTAGVPAAMRAQISNDREFEGWMARG